MDTKAAKRDKAVEAFEQNVVFRGARWVYLLLAVVAVVVVGGAVLVGAYGVAPLVDLGEPESPELVEPAAVDEARVSQTLQLLFAMEDDFDGEEIEYYDDGDGGDVYDGLGEDTELDAAIAEVEGLFNAQKEYPWLDSRECTRRGWRGGCYRWKKKRGARTVLLEAIRLQSTLSDVELVRMAYKLVLVSPHNDDGRFVYIGLFKDMMLATGGQPGDVIDAITEATKPADDWEEPALLGLALGLIKSKTQDAGAPPVVALVKQTPALQEVFGEAGLEQAIQLAWEHTGALSATDATAAREVILAVAREVPDYQRWRVFDAWRESTVEVVREADATNSERMAAWRAEVVEYEESMAEAESNRTAARASAVSGLGAGVLGICALGVLLAVLGVERNTRRTEALLRALQAHVAPHVGPGPADPGAEDAEDTLDDDDEVTNPKGGPAVA